MRTGTAERYVREWLEHHAASGLLEVDDPAAEPMERRYRLPAEHVPVLADPDDVRYRAFNGVEIARAGRWLPQLVEAFRTGDAPPPLAWAPEGRAEYNRAVYLNLLGTRWLRWAAMPWRPASAVWKSFPCRPTPGVSTGSISAGRRPRPPCRLPGPARAAALTRSSGPRTFGTLQTIGPGREGSDISARGAERAHV